MLMAANTSLPKVKHHSLVRMSTYEDVATRQIRNQPHLRLDHLDLLVAGEPEVDEPLPVEHLRHLLQNLDAPGVVLNQVVIGGENVSDSLLCRRSGTATSH